MINHKNELVVKANTLVEACYRLTLVEQRILLYAITEARRTQKGLNAEDFVTIRAADYAAQFSIDPATAYNQISEAAETIFNRYVTFHDVRQETGKPRRTKVRWISAASYIDGDGVIQLRFALDMVPFITRLESEFTRYKLGQIANMTSAHAIRMYELLIQWGSVGKREIEIEWFKKTLMLEGQYESIKNLKQRVIDVGVAQINKHSDITVQYTQRKTGRNVTHLTFTFGPKPMPKPAPKPKQAAEDGVPRTYYERKKYIEKHARPGEGWNEAASRLGVKYP